MTSLPPLLYLLCPDYDINNGLIINLTRDSQHLVWRMVSCIDRREAMIGVAELQGPRYRFVQAAQGEMCSNVNVLSLGVLHVLPDTTSLIQFLTGNFRSI